MDKLKQNTEETSNNNIPFTLQQNDHLENYDDVDGDRNALQPKLEIPDYISDDEKEDTLHNYLRNGEVTELTGGMEIIPQNTYLKLKECNTESTSCKCILYVENVICILEIL